MEWLAGQLRLKLRQTDLDPSLRRDATTLLRALQCPVFEKIVTIDVSPVSRGDGRGTRLRRRDICVCVCLREIRIASVDQDCQDAVAARLSCCSRSPERLAH